MFVILMLGTGMYNETPVVKMPRVYIIIYFLSYGMSQIETERHIIMSNLVSSLCTVHVLTQFYQPNSLEPIYSAVH